MTQRAGYSGGGFTGGVSVFFFVMIGIISLWISGRGGPVKRTMPDAIIVIALASIAATYNPLVGQWLIYDRSAIIDGEIWRLVTGHLYHFSSLHLWCNLVPLILIGICVERQSGSWFIGICLMMAMTIGVSLYIAHPWFVLGAAPDWFAAFSLFSGFPVLSQGGEEARSAVPR